ncbi:Ribosome assembly protein 1 [Neolecta irregularis DAH-3]|uniref:Ribosome assembly protein 1 n=1 Tax=Neolecta irregularis (strain DAH-3) TaxID=1198029 RepID=A0A1U7LTI5_NEOID|nr:Ribosome assembly protein 1 [Neolecta irregularis DAH-3]|eukprot:OLL25980.1 Ribosome assembly protein 1 [Neolecta irregularis DAH-3]
MPSPAELATLQSHPNAIRNICILAHVDHGKTSLSDSLLASNGIISAKLAGKIRYLDSREDEQIRGITMKSSAISLYYRIMRAQEDESYKAFEYLINLIDSPGHVDFSSEVSTASRLCDGALVLVDVVEGTVTVLRQVWTERIRPILVFNKIDRLITELRLTPLEAYTHMTKLLEQVNAVMGSFFAGDRMEEDAKWRERKEVGDLHDEFIEKDDADIYFAPERGNVVFSSAIDGWAFRIDQFAKLYSKKMGIKEANLKKVLWGDYFFDPKTKKVLQTKHLKGRNLKPIFVQLVLENLWTVYHCTVIEKNQEKVEKVVEALELNILSRDIKSKDSRALLSTIVSQWLPLSRAVLLAVIEEIPTPRDSQKLRFPQIISEAPFSKMLSQEIKKAMISCDGSSDAPVSAYVSKLMAVPESELPEKQRKQITAEEMRERGRIRREAKGLELKNESTEIATNSANSTPEEEQLEENEKKDKQVLIGFARLYSGVIKVGQELIVLGPKYKPSEPDQHISRIIVKSLYMMMGRDLLSLDSVPAGNVFGIGGLEGKVLKSATLYNTEGGINFAGVTMGTNPILRVALEPVFPLQMEQLVEGLKLLNQADPCVQVLIQDTGEHVILTAGELHLERCLKDLRERFAKIDITSSEPIVSFRETIVDAVDMTKDSRGRIEVSISSKQVTLQFRIRPLPSNVTEYLKTHNFPAKGGDRRANEIGKEAIEDVEQKELEMTLENFKLGLEKAFEAEGDGDSWEGVVDQISAFGPRKIGANILVDQTGVIRKLFPARLPEHDLKFPDYCSGITTRDIGDHILTGFQLSVLYGPLCSEQVEGIACFIEKIELSIPQDENDRSRISQLSGQVISATRDGIRQAFLEYSPRLMLAMYTCDIQTSPDVLGKVYAVVSQRRGHIVSEEMKEGTPFFTIKAKIPVIESFGFADDIRKRTSGAASPQLIFGGFEILDQDPFWVPTTEEELEDLGDTADKENIAKRYMDSIRKRKGLFVEKKLIKNAEKQRTLKR